MSMEQANQPEVLQLVRTDLESCRVYYKGGNRLYAFQRERADHFVPYECTVTGEPMVSVPMAAIDRVPDDYPEFQRWVDRASAAHMLNVGSRAANK